MEAFAYLQSVLWYESDLLRSTVHSNLTEFNASGIQQKQQRVAVVKPERHLEEPELIIYLMMP